MSHDHRAAHAGPDGGQSANQPAPALPEHEQQAKALAVVKALEPKRVIGFEKIRIGRDRDGGYIHVDDFEGVGAALSFGISDDPSWDIAIAGKSIPVYQFDHTIETAPAAHPLISFEKLRIAASDGAGCVSLDTLASRLPPDCWRALLKVDIEGDEWSVFNAASCETLARFSQVVCEFHDFELCADPVWSDRLIHVLTKLAEIFAVVHVHGNNAMPFVNVGNVVIPRLLEITYANRLHYRFAETNEVFPTALDRPNVPEHPDMRLGCFKF